MLHLRGTEVTQDTTARRGTVLSHNAGKWQRNSQYVLNHVRAELQIDDDTKNCDDTKIDDDTNRQD